MIDEQWRPIAEFPGYDVSSHGRVRHGDRLMSSYQSKDGYITIGLWLGRWHGGQKLSKVHRLVCAAFHGPRPSLDHFTAHLDGSKTNNHYLNLAWKTRKENEADKIIHGTRPQGSRHGMAVLSAAEVFLIRRAYSCAKLEKRPIRKLFADLSKQFNVSRGCIEHTIYEDTWQHSTMIAELVNHPEVLACMQTIADAAAKQKISLPGCRVVKEQRAA
jgi:hypothetical protein